MSNGNCCCNICKEIKELFNNSAPIDASTFLTLYDEADGCSRTTLSNLLSSSLSATDDQNCTSKKKIGSIDIVGVVTDFFESVTSFGTPVVDSTTDPNNVEVTIPYTNENCTVQDVIFTIPIPEPISVYDSIDLKFDANGDLLVEAVYTDDSGSQYTITDTTPITLPQNEDYVEYTGNNTVPTGTPPLGVDTRVLANGDRYDWNGSAWILVPAAVLPVYTTCDGTDLTVTDRIVTAPTGSYASGYSVNQTDANGCLTLSDIYYNLARRSHTFGHNYMSNEALGYGSSITGGLRNTTATGASYSHIGGGYDHSITTGTANFIGGGRNNDITAGSYNGITHGYNQNITAGNYNTIGGGVSNDIKAGSYNTIVGGSAIDFEAGTGSYNVAGGVNTTFNGGSYNTAFGNNHISDGGVAGFMVGQQNRIRAGNYVSQLGYSHDNVAGNSTTQGGYNHTNTAGSYNTQLGYAHINTTGQSVFQGGQSNINRSGNYTVQLGFSHDNTGTGNSQVGYDHLATGGSYGGMYGIQNRIDGGTRNNILGSSSRVRGGNYNIATGHSHDILAGSGHAVHGYNNTVNGGNYSMINAVNSIYRGGNYSGMWGFSHDNTGTGNMLIGYNNTTNTNYSVSIGRNLNNTTSDGIMIANTFQRLGFFGTTPITRQTANTLPQLLAALKAYGLIL